LQLWELVIIAVVVKGPDHAVRGHVTSFFHNFSLCTNTNIPESVPEGIWLQSRRSFGRHPPSQLCEKTLISS
jgi:hypothetical protein